VKSNKHSYPELLCGQRSNIHAVREIWYEALCLCLESCLLILRYHEGDLSLHQVVHLGHGGQLADGVLDRRNSGQHDARMRSHISDWRLAHASLEWRGSSWRFGEGKDSDFNASSMYTWIIIPLFASVNGSTATGSLIGFRVFCWCGVSRTKGINAHVLRIWVQNG
jgi:hypothetical protein